MNAISLVGRIVKDIEVKQSNNGKNVGSFTLAVSRPFKNQNGEYESDFINCVVFDDNRINVLKSYTTKGSRLALNGRLQIDNWQDNGTWKSFTKVIVNDITLIETKQEHSQLQNQGQGQQSYNNNNNQQQAPQQRQQQNYNEPTPPPLPEDLPF